MQNIKSDLVSVWENLKHIVFNLFFWTYKFLAFCISIFYKTTTTESKQIELKKDPNRI